MKLLSLSVALLFFAAAIPGSGDDAGTILAAPAISRLAGTHLYPSPSPSGKSFCEFQYDGANDVASIRFYHHDPDGQWRTSRNSIVTEWNISQYIYGLSPFGLSCLDDTIWFLGMDESTGQVSFWQTSAPVGTPAPTILPGVTIQTDHGAFKYQGNAIAPLTRNAHLLAVAYTATNPIAVEMIPNGTNRLAADLGNRQISAVCTTTDALYTMDGNTGNYERWVNGASQILETVDDLGYAADGNLIRGTWTMGCSPAAGALVFQKSGGLSVNVGNSTSSIHVSLGSTIAGYPANDVRQLAIDANGTVYWVMTVPSAAHIAEGAAFALNGSAAAVVQLSPRPSQDIGLLSLGGAMSWFTNGTIRKPE